MTSPDALKKEPRTAPLYFFDQPRKRSRIKGKRASILHFNLANGVQFEDTTQSRPVSENNEGYRDELTERSGETCGDAEPDWQMPTSSYVRNKDDPLNNYIQAAPELLDELSRVLSQHEWAKRGCVPHGIVNILNCSWQDLTAAAKLHLKSAKQANDKRRKVNKDSSAKPDEARTSQVSADDKRKAAGAEKNSGGVDSVGPTPARKTQFGASPRVKKRKKDPNKGRKSPTVSFTISSDSCNDPETYPGWIVKRTEPSCDLPQRINVCQWVVDRLQEARKHGKLHRAEPEQNKALIRRHYGDAKAKVKDRSGKRKVQAATLVNGMPQIPAVKQQQGPARHKLHYRLTDGSCFVYYKSGCAAVCHSHSGLPCGGFYTNVFSDGECPVVLATITAFGRAAVTCPVSSAITALWNQDGGLIRDPHGNITKEWSWQRERTPREHIVIQLSDSISVKLLSGTSAVLTYSCNNESVQIPLSALPNTSQSKGKPYLQTEGEFTSDAATDLLQTRKNKSPAVVLESQRKLMLTPVSGCPRDVVQMLREVEGLEEPSAQWRKEGGGDVGRDLKRLQMRVRIALDDWLDHYRAAIGIKCPDTERVPDAPQWARLRREMHSAAPPPPPKKPPERERARVEPVRTAEEEEEVEDEEPVGTEEEGGGNESPEPQASLSSPTERPVDSSGKPLRTSKKRPKEEPPQITQIGPLQIHNLKPELVIIPSGKDLQSAVVASTRRFPPSVPLTVCPPLLRAALLEDEAGVGGGGWSVGGRRRCCCSPAAMPTLSDLEYDAFIAGQPPHSQQILVVCVCVPRKPVGTHHTATAARAATAAAARAPVEPKQQQDVLEQLHRRTNKHRTMPCTQCQLDSFRLVRYEMSVGFSDFGDENVLLQQRHNAAPGMVLMYIRGKLLFVGYTLSVHGSCSVRDLQKQICRTRADYRLGVSLPPDYRFSEEANSAKEAQSTPQAKLKPYIMSTASVDKERASERRNRGMLVRQRDFSIKPQKSPAFPRAPFITR